MENWSSVLSKLSSAQIVAAVPSNRFSQSARRSHAVLVLEASNLRGELKAALEAAVEEHVREGRRGHRERPQELLAVRVELLVEGSQRWPLPHQPKLAVHQPVARIPYWRRDRSPGNVRTLQGLRRA